MTHSEEPSQSDGEHTHRAARRESGGYGIHVPTVMLSVGLSALASAVVLVIGAVLLVTIGVPEQSAKSDDSATVLDLSSGQAGSATPTPKAGTPRNGTTPKAAAPAKAPAQGSPNSHGGSAGAPAAGGAQPAPAPAQDQQDQPVAPAPAADGAEAAAQPAPAPSGPAQPSAGELDALAHLAMDPGANRGERAAALEAGDRGLGVLDAIGGVIKASGYGFTYKVNEPVRMDGDSASATLQMSVAGNGSKFQELTWNWIDGRWKLTNGSVCALAGLALLPCSL